MAETRPWVPVPPDDLVKESADYLKAIFREFAASPEVENTPFQIIGILAVQKNLHTVFATSRSFFDTLVGLFSEEEPDEEEEPLSEEELLDSYTLVSERADGVVAPYEEWRAGYERFAAQEETIKNRQLVVGLVAMLLLPDQQTHPIMRRRLLEPSDA